MEGAQSGTPPREFAGDTPKTLTHSLPLVFASRLNPSMSLTPLRLHSPTTADKLSRTFDISRPATSPRLNLFERRVKCGVQFCLFLSASVTRQTRCSELVLTGLLRSLLE